MNDTSATASAAPAARQLTVDLDTPFARHWCGGGVFKTAFFNALSQGFPPGEQLFIDSVRNCLALLPPEKRDRHEAAIQGFIAQEAIHRRIHGLFNAQLERQGLHNLWTPRAEQRIRRIKGFSPRHKLGLTVAYEHFTALLGQWLLFHPDVFDGCEERIKALWFWHACEELEHKSVAFDVYRDIGGGHGWRRWWMLAATLVFATDCLHQTVCNLRNDGTLWRRRTWASAGSFLFGKRGLLRHAFGHWCAFLRRDFHPSEETSPLAQDWLKANSDKFRLVGARTN
jgi:predicted metal-dependent hydrolase